MIVTSIRPEMHNLLQRTVNYFYLYRLVEARQVQFLSSAKLGLGKTAIHHGR